jgi:hypothetical protein
LPGALAADEVIERTAKVEALLDRCCDPSLFPAPPATMDEAVRELRRQCA